MPSPTDPTPGNTGAPDAPVDVICIGRAAVDLYSLQVGARLEDATLFARYLGGSPANTAYGAARLGLRPAMLARVGDEHHGRFVRETLAAAGVDVSALRTDPQRLTALAFLGLRDEHTFPLLFYRHDCADMAIEAADLPEALFARSRAVLLSGTHLSRPGPLAACRAAVALARRHGARVVLDIDYRPVLWGLAGLGEGENRFVADAGVSAHLLSVVGDCDLLVGTEEEIHIAGGHTDTLAALRTLRTQSAATIVLKRGAAGCVVFDGAIPDAVDEGLVVPGFPVEVFNVLGAGDAFMAGFLRGWLRDEPLRTCATWANAAGALVVSRHGCAPAMPSWAELQHLLQRAGDGRMPRRLRDDTPLTHLHHASNRARAWPPLAVLAFDHRAQLEAMADAAGVPHDRIRDVKRLVADAALAVRPPDGMAAGVLVDDRHGATELPRFTATGRWVGRPVERPGCTPLAWDLPGDLGLAIAAWPPDHVAKVLVVFDADQPAALRDAQIARLAELQQACTALDREWLLELLPPPERAAGTDADRSADAMTRIYDAGLRPDWWKLPAARRDTWDARLDVIARHDPWCRGAVMLGADAPLDVLAEQFAQAPAGVRGFMVGRSLFAAGAQAWLHGTLDDDGLRRTVAERFDTVAAAWRRTRPTR